MGCAGGFHRTPSVDKADISVDSVHTRFDRTNSPTQFPGWPRETFREPLPNKIGFIMSYLHPNPMNRCWPSTANPTEPERGTA
ncbi:hypothetical protein AHiyo1_32160 [Arthrobacter sp. Hiyo1]|nr:hypothetical protein AHiyo1_32160 [Arthrobacter sp. Hiyo1]